MLRTFKISLHSKNTFISVYILMAVIHLVYICFYSVDIPYWDEWTIFHQNSFAIQPSLESLFQQHNEHKLVIPTFFFYVYTHFFHFHVPTLVVFNYFIYILFYSFFVFTIFKNFEFKPYLFLLLIPLSPLNYENLVWPFQIQWHLNVMFVFLACLIFYKTKKSKIDFLLAIFLPFMMVFTLGSGVGAAAILALYTIYYSTRCLIQKIHFNLSFNTIFTFTCVASILSYFYNYTKPEGTPATTTPFTDMFWLHFSALLSLGSGNKDSKLILFGFIILILFIFNVYKVEFLNGLEKNKKFLYLFSICLIGMLGPISLSRAEFGLTQAFSSRYFEFSSIFFVTTIIILFSQNKSLKVNKFVSVYIGVLLLINIYSLLRFQHYYSDIQNARNRAFECVKKAYQNDHNTVCPDAYPLEINVFLNTIKENNLDLSFIKKFKSSN